MAGAENVERVYPTRSELEKESQTNVQCPIIGCPKIFRQSSALRFHLVKLHRLILNESDARLAQQLKPQTKKEYEYYCPESNCRFSGHEQKFFQSYKKLKQHFMRLHAQRTLVCSICGEKFGLGYDLTRHVSRCRQKPWCLSCQLCMGSWEDLAQHLSETGHSGVSDQCSEDVNSTETPDQQINETRGMSPIECSDRTGVGQASTVSQTLHDSSCDVETGIVGKKEQAITVKTSDEITKPTVIVPSRELKEIAHSDMPSDLPSSSESRNEETADQSSQTTVISKSKDISPSSRKKRSCLDRLEQDATPPRTILPAPSFMVIPPPVGTVFFYTVPAHQSKPKLKRLAPRQSSSQLELDPAGVSRILPVTGDSLVTDGYKRDTWTTCSTHDSKSLDSAPESVTASTQTRSRKIKVAETQTMEGYVLKKTPGIYNSPLSRQSCGSQVSPRARVKRLNVQSIHTQTSRTLARKQKHSISMQTTQETVSTVIPTTPPTDAWPDFVHNETQTMELLQQLQASLAESSSTQTLESYLFDNFPSENCISTSSNDMRANPCSTVNVLPDSVYATISAEGSDLFDSGMLPIAEAPPKKSTTSEYISNESDYSLFSSQFPNIVEGEQNRSDVQCSNFLINDEMFVRSDFDSSEASTSARCNDDLLTQQKTFTAETQTMHPDCLNDFLTAASQTNDFDDMSINTETQTVDDDFFTQFWSHMETQTTDEFLTEFGFSDIETQTTWVFREDVLPLEVAQGIPPQEPQGAVLLDMETQTCFQ